ncbi:NAD(P)-binding domain-containing protein [Chitinophagaceae bacterium LB-8]|uniref:NAD(P)-binding domain-containing protein n=1 Tax=Paraflavisolibacter caeni TaxID=2982496 RepID=A0A9X2Y2B0_9BACT|nr:NAD(P)-binding domain-containing protein [Paraflavisolibacter caeni]MCU7552363.1 NAD(P)-binding domain-containing protein [Paraflavisolibacter caeni]
MKIGILGTGMVGETIASALLDKNHDVMIGSRTATNEKVAELVKKNSKHASQGTFNDAAAYGDIVFICLNGEHALDVIRSLDEFNTANKIFVDITNPLDFTHGMPPRLINGLSNNNSLGEEIQRLLPNAYVIKALNTVNHKLMVDARQVNNGDHNLFVCGNNADIKNKMMHFFVDNFHWRPERLIDLGGIEMARCTEAYVPFWVAIWQATGSPMFNLKVVQ